MSMEFFVIRQGVSDSFLKRKIIMEDAEMENRQPNVISEQSSVVNQSVLPKDLKLTAETLPFVNLALHNNKIGFIRSLTVSGGECAVEGACLTVSANPEFFKPFTKQLDYIPEKQDLSLRDINPVVDVNYLAALTERVNAAVTFTLSVNGETAAEEVREVAVLTFDQWHGSSVYPELLCSFITPNHPQIASVITKSAALLNEWTGNPSFDAYQSKDPNRVIKQAASIYAAIKQMNIVYAEAPASYEILGQRVRLCDAVLEQKIGNCLDMTLLYSGCLEAVGLHPLLILTKGHIFTGLWLEDLTFPEAVQDDTSLITKRLAGGINEIAAVETTLLNAGKNVSFDKAMEAGESELCGINAAECIIDVSRARLSGIRPLPLRVKNANGEYQVNFSELGDTDAANNAPKDLSETVNVAEGIEAAPLSKKAQWERKLLDLGLRNPLINLRLSKTVVPILTTSLGDLEDALADGEEFMIMQKPDEWKPEGDMDFENIGILGKAGDLIKSEFSNKRLRSVHTEGELAKLITNLYRTSRTAMEENGANTLYLALGLLRWFETDKSPKPRYAPIVLLPVEIVRKSALKGYVIRLRDDEAQMNITMLEKMKQDFGITVSGLDPLPLDEHGIDMRTVFAVLRKAVMGQARWDVLESAYLGIFSFSQFVMWNDIRNRSDDLSKNKIVKSLIDGRLSWETEAMETGGRVEESGVLTPMAADASQLFAIRSACEGKSFVLHGPPGTGKSQTITSLIANALAEGKSVLFAAEKMAALEVVQKRLDKIGIGAFCLELHSNKARKKEVLEQLRIVSEVTKNTSPTRYKEKAEQIQKVREELNTYAERIHTPLNCGGTLFQLINEYEDYRGAKDTEPFTSDFTSKLSSKDIEELDSAVNKLTAAGLAAKKAVASTEGGLYNHPLGRVSLCEYSQQLKTVIPQKISAYKSALTELIPLQEKITAALDFDMPKSFDGEQGLAKTAERLSVWNGFPASWRTVQNASFVFTQTEEAAAHFIFARERENDLLQSFNPTFLQQDGNALLNEYNSVNAKWALPKAMGLNSMAKRLSGFAKSPVDKTALLQHINKLCDYQQERAKADSLFSQIGSSLGELYQGEHTDWSRVCDLAKAARESCHGLSQMGITEERRAALFQGDILTLSERFKTKYTVTEAAKLDLYAALQITEGEGVNWLLTESALCDGISQNTDSLKEWIAFNAAAREANGKGLASVVAEYRSGLSDDEVFPAYKKALLLNLINTAVDNDKVLSGFSGAVFNQRIEDLKKLDAEIMDLSKEEIFCRLASRLPDFSREASSNEEIAALQKMIKSGGRGVSIRKMFERLSALIPRLCPCMLMSPISAAQYLDPHREPFDIVVFDEASQLTTCKAVGVLARGKDAVIVGDPKQMPPTSFFSTNSTDEENLEAEDLESILDDCLALNMPQAHLLWHYRSRHESLIAFSNSRFYENRLFTFPSVNDRESKVTLVHVDGVFDRGKTRQNKAEAEAIIEELKRRCHSEELSKNSVGVVTFNISQQTLIEDLLNEACKTDSELEHWAFNSEEPVFVKNLENVQGDERDVILFSVGYGPDKDGNVYMNFGPLNREGGWRRLNVAVSRARCEMMIFATLTADQINLSRTSAEGAAALKAFLEYASGKPLPISEYAAHKSKRIKENVAKAICRELKAVGYDTDISVGHSEYKIDIGVVDPENPERYILGILLDGESYGNAKTTRDREIAQISVLEGLGWKILRVWSMDWWDNQGKELGRIRETLGK